MINRRSFNTILLGTTALSFAACTGLTDFSLPTNKKVFVQFIVQSSPATSLPTLFDTNKYAYCEFTNADNGIYDHYKIDYSDSNLGYQGNSFFYN